VAIRETTNEVHVDGKALTALELDSSFVVQPVIPTLVFGHCDHQVRMREGRQCVAVVLVAVEIVSDFLQELC
jgi:hypothetical protein